MTGKKILFTSHTANFSKFNRPFMKWLRENGNEVHYASAGEEEVFDCDKHFTIPFTRSPFKASNIHAYKQLKQIIDAENYDLIHTHTPMGSVVTRLAARDARKKGTRIIYTAHGFHFFKGAPLLNWITYYPIEKFMARHTDTLITINNEDYERARSRFNTEVRYVSGVGIDEAKFNQTITHEERQKLRSSLGLKRGDFAIIYLAELSKRKNQLWLIEAMAPLMLMNPELHLILAGSDSLNGKCQQLAKELCLENNIHFLGYRKDVVELLQSSDLAVSSSLQEGLPVNVMEAMHVGLPVVAIDCRGNRDLIRDGANGFLVHKGDARDLRDRISLLHVDAKLRTLFSQNSRQIIKNYLLDDVMNEMGKIYSRKKIIVHLLNSNKFSGAENVACELIKQGANKYDSYYCSPEGDINAALRARNVRHIGINALSYFEVSRIVRKYRPDIIHAHDFRASILASFFGRKASIISHIHQNPKWLNGRNVYTMLYRWRIKKFKKIFVVTDVIKKNRVFNNLPEGTVATHHNKIDKEAIIKKAGRTNDKKYDIGFCGRLEPVKQPLDFIKIVAEIKKSNANIRAIMVGDGSLRNDCMQLIDELDLKNNIKLVGFQTNPYRYIKDCRFLMITSQAEGFGLVAIEAMLLGAIVISYDLDSIREIMGENSKTIGSSIDELVHIYHTYTASLPSVKAQINRNMKIAGAFTYTAQSKYGSTDRLYGNI